MTIDMIQTTRPDRLAADLAAFVHAAWSGVRVYHVGRQGAPLLYADLATAIQALALTSEELTVVYVYLRRYFRSLIGQQHRAVSGADDSSSLSLMTASATSSTQQMRQLVAYALYMEQLSVHDVPMSKKFWHHISGGVEWLAFLEGAVQFAQAIDFDLSCEPEQLTSGYIELVRVIEPQAVMLFQLLDLPPESAVLEDIQLLQTQAVEMQRACQSLKQFTDANLYQLSGVQPAGGA